MALSLLECGGQFATLTTFARTFAVFNFSLGVKCLSGYSYYPQRHIQTNFSVQKFERAVVVNDRKSHQRAQVFALSRPCVRHFSLSSWFPMTESMPRTFTAYRVAVGMGKVGTKPCGLFTAYPLGYVLQKNVKSKSKLLLCTVLLPLTYSPRCIALVVFVHNVGGFPVFKHFAYPLALCSLFAWFTYYTLCEQMSIIL